MRLSGPKEVLNFDKILPLDGENRFDLYYAEREIVLNIFYDSCTDSVVEVKKTIRFSGAKYFYKMPFPGCSIFNCVDDNEVVLLNSLVVYDYSEMVEKDSGSASVCDYKHYRLFLHSVGVAIYVIAELCTVE